jgi:hypothetical protein
MSKDSIPPLFKSFSLHESCREGQFDKVVEALDNAKDLKKLIESKDEDDRTV